LAAIMNQRQAVQAEKSAQQANRPKLDGDQRTNSMFLPSKEGTYKIRILPPQDGSPFKELYFHKVRLNNSNSLIYALDKNNGTAPTPLTVASEKLWAKFKDFKDRVHND